MKRKLESCTIFIGKLPLSCTESDIKVLVEEFGTPRSIYMNKKSMNVQGKKKQRFAGCVHVEFETTKEAQEAVKKLDKMNFCGRPLNADFATEKEQKFVAKSDPSEYIFIGNLPYSTTNEELEEILSETEGFVELRRKENQGHAYATFESIEQATKALESLSGRQIENRHLRLDFAP